MQFFKMFFVFLAGMILATVQSAAAIVPADFALDTSEVQTIATAILAGLAIIWVARKVISMLR